MRFTQEQIDQAKQVPVERIAKSVGYTVVKKGRYFSLEEMDSLMINTRKNLWWRYRPKLTEKRTASVVQSKQWTRTRCGCTRMHSFSSITRRYGKHCTSGRKKYQMGRLRTGHRQTSKFSS